MGYLLESIGELDHQLKKPIDSDFNSFKILLFEVKWYRLWMHEHDTERTVIEHDNGFTMVNTRDLKRVQSLMFFQVNVSKYFTQRYLINKVGHTLLDTIQEED